MVEISETRKSQHCISNLSEVSELFQKHQVGLCKD